MKVSRGIFVFTLVTLFLLVEASTVLAQERYSVAVGRCWGFVRGCG